MGNSRTASDRYFVFVPSSCRVAPDFMPKRGNQRRVAAGRKGPIKQKAMRIDSTLAELDDARNDMIASAWAAQSDDMLFKRIPLELIERTVILSTPKLSEQTNLLARLGATCSALRCVELELGTQLDMRARVACAYRVWVVAARRAAKHAEKQATSERKRHETERCESEWRGQLAVQFGAVYGEVVGREEELARMLGAKGEPPVLRVLSDSAFRDSADTVCADSTYGLAEAFPSLATAARECGPGYVYKELAAYVRSMLVRADVAPPRMLHRACHLRVPMGGA